MTIESELKDLTNAVKGLTAVLQNAALSTPAPAPAKKEKAAPKQPVETPQVETAPVGESTPTTAPADGEKYADAASQTVDQIRARLTLVIQKKGAEPVEQALKSMGFDTLSAVTSDKYPKLLSLISADIREEV